MSGSSDGIIEFKVRKYDIGDMESDHRLNNDYGFFLVDPGEDVDKLSKLEALHFDVDENYFENFPIEKVKSVKGNREVIDDGIFKWKEPWRLSDWTPVNGEEENLNVEVYRFTGIVWAYNVSIVGDGNGDTCCGVEFEMQELGTTDALQGLWQEILLDTRTQWRERFDKYERLKELNTVDHKTDFRFLALVGYWSSQDYQGDYDSGVDYYGRLNLNKIQNALVTPKDMKAWHAEHDKAKERWEKSTKLFFVIDEQDDIVAADFDTEGECTEWISKQSSPSIYYIERNPRCAILPGNNL